MPHTRVAGSRSEEPAPSPARTCARCGGPLFPSGGRARKSARYCSATCRHADVRERRAAARADLLAALEQLGEATTRIERALQVMGFRPTHPRASRDC